MIRPGRKVYDVMESSQLSRKLRRMSNEGGLALTADKGEGDKLESGLVRGIKDKLLKGAKVPRAVLSNSVLFQGRLHLVANTSACQEFLRGEYGWRTRGRLCPRVWGEGTARTKVWPRF